MKEKNVNIEAFTNERIKKVAFELFSKYGYSKVTVEEISSVLGISKKTFYKHFSNKNELLRKIVEDLLTEVSTKIKTTINNEDIDYVERLHRLMTIVGIRMSEIGMDLMVDVQRNAPEIWGEIERFRKAHIITFFRAFLEEGVTKGIIRNDVNLDLVLSIFLSSVQSILNPEVLSHLPLSIKEAINTILKVIFDGIFIEGNRF